MAPPDRSARRYRWAQMVDEGANQSTILLAGSGYASAFPSGPVADFTDADLNLSPDGGAVCFPDGSPRLRLLWLVHAPVAGLPSRSGPNASPDGIPAGMALTRCISAGCATLLEAGDDTNTSAVDFARDVPHPASQLPAARASAPALRRPRPQTRILSGPQGKTTDRTPTFRFSSSPPVAAFAAGSTAGPSRAAPRPDLRQARVRPAPIPGQGGEGRPRRLSPASRSSASAGRAEVAARG